MDSELQCELNILLAILRDVNVVKLVQEEFTKYNNPAPSLLLERSIEKLQEKLNKSYYPTKK